MPVWLEVFLVWLAIGTILNILAYTVLRKRSYFRWLNDIHDTIAYETGYKDAKKEMAYGDPVYDSFSRNTFTHQLREHGVEDNRYK